MKIVYWIATGLVALVYLGGGAFYIFAHQIVVGMYEGLLHYPTYIIWPLAILLHSLGALYQQFWLKSGVLASMLRPEPPTTDIRSG